MDDSRICSRGFLEVVLYGALARRTQLKSHVAQDCQKWCEEISSIIICMVIAIKNSPF